MRGRDRICSFRNSISPRQHPIIDDEGGTSLIAPLALEPLPGVVQRYINAQET